MLKQTVAKESFTVFKMEVTASFFTLTEEKNKNNLKITFKYFSNVFNQKTYFPDIIYWLYCIGFYKR